MTQPGLNDPSSYYACDQHPSLVWEMTICQCLARADGAYQTALCAPKRYGETIAEFLQARVGLNADWSLVEVGGGYGTLMAALLDVVPVRRVTMVDVSPFFVEQQRQALIGREGVEHRRCDAVEFLGGLDREVDLVISNENIGDFRTYTGVPRDEVLRRIGRGTSGGAPGASQDQIADHVAEKAARYGLDLMSAPESFAFNIGAIEYVEALYPKARAVFLSEHGADTVIPEPYCDFVTPESSNGYPRRIPLKGHDEYSIRFGHLEQVAKKLGYEVARFHMMDVLDLRDDEGVQFMVRALNTQSETAELLREFYHHVAEYQCMLLMR